jgi:hypothetical protein
MKESIENGVISLAAKSVIMNNGVMKMKKNMSSAWRHQRNVNVAAWRNVEMAWRLMA